MEGPGAFIVICIVGIVVAFIMRSVAVSVYRKTGVNTIKGIHKALWYVEAVAILGGIGAELSPVLLVLMIVAFAALHAVLSLKAGVANAVIMGVLQAVGGMMAALLQVVVWLLNISMSISGMGGGKTANIAGVFNINETYEAERSAAAARYEQQKAADNEAADAYAQHQGFRNADEAEAFGIRTGKRDD